MRLVSIILCTYNRGHTLKETLDSILKQTYKEFELIIVDDGSTDGTQELLKEYNDTRIRIISLEENEFYCMAANYGISQMKGEFLAFATSDDTWEPEKLEQQMDALEKDKELGACFTFSDVMDEDGKKADGEFEMLSGLLIKNFREPKEWIQHFIFEGNCLCHPSAVIKKEVIEQIGGFNLLYCQSADLDLWLRIVREYPICVLEIPLVHYRCYKNPKMQISGADEMKAARFLNEHMMIRKKFINDLKEKEMREFFGEYFQIEEAEGHLEIEIEKAFLLMQCADGLPDFRILGIEKFEELLRIPEAVDILRKKYNVKPLDIYNWNLGHFYMDFGIHVRLAQQESTIKGQKEQIVELGRSLKFLNKEAEETERECEKLSGLLEEALLQNLKLEEQATGKYKGRRR